MSTKEPVAYLFENLAYPRQLSFKPLSEHLVMGPGWKEIPLYKASTLSAQRAGTEGDYVSPSVEADASPQESSMAVDASRHVAPPDGVREALAAYDEATRAHLKDCWLGSDEPSEMIEARYNDYRESKNKLDRALGQWTGRHASEFEAMQRSVSDEPQASAEAFLRSDAIATEGNHKTLLDEFTPEELANWDGRDEMAIVGTPKSPQGDVEKLIERKVEDAKTTLRLKAKEAAKGHDWVVNTVVMRSEDFLSIVDFYSQALARLKEERDEAARQEILCRADGNVEIGLRKAAESSLSESNRRIEELTKALELAICRLGKLEPGDSRAVSDEFVAMAAVLAGNPNEESLEIIDKAQSPALQENDNGDGNSSFDDAAQD